MPVEKFLRVCDTMIVSIARYGMELWCRSRANQIKVQRVLNNVLRMVYEAGRRSSATALIMQSGWLNAHNMHHLISCCTLRRLLFTRAAPYTFSLIRRELQRYETRNNDVVLSVRSQNSYGDNCYIISAVAMYNRLGLAGAILSPDEFKSICRSRLVTEYGNSNL